MKESVKSLEKRKYRDYNKRKNGDGTYENHCI